MATYLLGMAVVLYDFEIRPWGTWPLVVFFITNALCVRCDRPIHPKNTALPLLPATPCSLTQRWRSVESRLRSMCVLSLDPFLSLHDWPDELATEVMESTELAWSPSDKSNFVVLVTTTRVP